MNTNSNRPAPVPSGYNDPLQPVVLTAEQVAQILQVPVSWARERSRRRCADPLPVFEAGRYKRYRLEDVMAWLEEHKRGTRKKIRSVMQ